MEAIEIRLYQKSYDIFSCFIELCDDLFYYYECIYNKKNMKLINILKESLLLEYIENDIIYLKKYLSMSDDEKKDELISKFGYLVNYFIELNYYEDLELDEDNDVETNIEILKNDYPDIYEEFKNWLLNETESFNLNIDDSEYPTWVFMDKPKIFKNNWLIHFTDDAISIAENGFKYGVYDMEKLGLTRHLSQYDKGEPGYNFAFNIHDRLNKNYGKEAVIFKASGIRFWHYEDEEWQVIFKGDTAKNIVPIVEGENKTYGIFNKNNGATIYEDNDIENIINWVVNNYNQYKNII